MKPSNFRDESSDVAIVAVGVPADQRTLSVDRVFWSHFSPNISPSGWIVGILLINSGLDFWSALAATLLGNVIGGVPPAIAALLGPIEGRTQIETSRASFGRRGLRIPAALTWLGSVGWNAVNNIPAAFSLLTLVALGGLHISYLVALAVLVLVQGYASVRGHHIVQELQKFLGYALLLAFGVTGIFAVRQGGTIATSHGFALVPFVLGVALVAAYTFGWAPYASDYTRYLPVKTSRRQIFTLGFAGLFVSSFTTEFFGILTSSHFQDTTALGVITGVVKLTGAFGPIALLAFIIASITANSLSINTASYSLISAGIHLPRNIAAALTAGAAFILALLGVGRFSSLYESYLFLLGYWIAPWLGIVLADWFLQRSMPETEQEWKRGATIFIVVATATIALFSSTDIYTGPVARLLGGADIGYFVGFFAAPLLYVATKSGRDPMSIDVPHPAYTER